jgi:hypothetical protein
MKNPSTSPIISAPPDSIPAMRMVVSSSMKAGLLPLKPPQAKKTSTEAKTKK